MMNALWAETYAHITGSLEALYIGRPRRSYQILVYNKLLEQQTNSANRYLQG